MHHFLYSCIYRVNKAEIFCSRFRHIIIIIIIVKAYLNVLFSCQICMFICMYVCMHVCTKSFLKTTTNSLCVCTHLANKADSDSDSDVPLASYSMGTL